MGKGHGLINYKDTKTKCRLYWCLKEFIDWRLESCWYFWPSFVNYYPSNLLSSSPPPLPKVNVQYMQTVCGWEGVGGCLVVLETIFCWSLTLCLWPDSEPTKLIYHPEQNQEGREPQTDKHLPLRPITSKFFRWHFALFLRFTGCTILFIAKIAKGYIIWKRIIQNVLFSSSIALYVSVNRICFVGFLSEQKQ